MKDSSMITVVILTIIIVILATLLLVSEARAEFFGYGEFGYNPKGDDYYAEMELGYRFNPWKLKIEFYGGIEVLMEKAYRVFFYPYRDIYTAGGTIRFSHVYVNIEHKCIHSVHATDKQFEERFIVPDSRTRIGIGFEF